MKGALVVVDIFLLIVWVRVSREVENVGPDLWWVTYRQFSCSGEERPRSRND